MVESWMVDDFEAFVEMTEDLCEEDYGLVLVYRHHNEDNSYYFSYLATDESGEVIEKFFLRLLISNHNTHSMKQRKKNKIQESQSEKLLELFKNKPIPKLRGYHIHITVNGDAYDSYDEAFEDFEQLLQRAVEVMHN